VWIGTAGLGLFIYRIHTHKPVASWGKESKLEIFTLLHVRKTASILALTHDGIFVFDSNLSYTGMEAVCILEPRQTIERSGPLDINQGVVIPATGNIDDPEIWVCSSSGREFTILHNEKYSTIAEVYYSDGPEEKGRMVRHMQPILADGRSYLAVADRHMIERWDVKLRQKKDQFDMMTHCVEFFGSQSKFSHLLLILYYLSTGESGQKLMITNGPLIRWLKLRDAWLLKSGIIINIMYAFLRSDHFNSQLIILHSTFRTKESNNYHDLLW
jgi:hypothetical protein